MSQDKCACPDCTCGTSGDHAVTRDGKKYCSQVCADGHPDGAGCCDGGCPCKG